MIRDARDWDNHERARLYLDTVGPVAFLDRTEPDPPLTLLDVALSGIGLGGSVGGVTSCRLVRDVEESLANRAVDLSPTDATRAQAKSDLGARESNHGLLSPQRGRRTTA